MNSARRGAGRAKNSSGGAAAPGRSSRNPQQTKGADTGARPGGRHTTGTAPTSTRSLPGDSGTTSAVNDNQSTIFNATTAEILRGKTLPKVNRFSAVGHSTFRERKEQIRFEKESIIARERFKKLLEEQVARKSSPLSEAEEMILNNGHQFIAERLSIFKGHLPQPTIELSEAHTYIVTELESALADLDPVRRLSRSAKVIEGFQAIPDPDGQPANQQESAQQAVKKLWTNIFIEHPKGKLPELLKDLIEADASREYIIQSKDEELKEVAKFTMVSINTWLRYSSQIDNHLQRHTIVRKAILAAQGLGATEIYDSRTNKWIKNHSRPSLVETKIALDERETLIGRGIDKAARAFIPTPVYNWMYQPASDAEMAEIKTDLQLLSIVLGESKEHRELFGYTEIDKNGNEVQRFKGRIKEAEEWAGHVAERYTEAEKMGSAMINPLLMQGIAQSDINDFYDRMTNNRLRDLDRLDSMLKNSGAKLTVSADEFLDSLENLRDWEERLKLANEAFVSIKRRGDELAETLWIHVVQSLN